MKTGLNHAVRVTVAALSIVLGLSAAVPAAAQCPGDVIPSGAVNGTDLAELLATWGPCTGCAADIDASGSVDGNDLAVILGAWGPCSPVITSIMPNTGPASGGTPITIIGSYFTVPATVTLGGVSATSVQVVNATTITAVTPTASPGTVDVVVTMGGSTGLLASGFVFNQLVPGTVRAWGRNTHGQCSIPPDLGLCIAIDGGYSHSIAVRLDGSVRAWGSNAYGQSSPPPDLGFTTAIAAGGYHNVALSWDGTVRAWGKNQVGQCVVPASIGVCRAVSAGSDNSGALRGDGTVVVWGEQSGPVDVPTGLTGYALSIGTAGLVLQESGLVVAWGGSCVWGECVTPRNLDICTYIAGGYGHSIAITGNGTIRSWGDNQFGQCETPLDLSPCVRVAGGSGFTVALQVDGTVKAWGNNFYGQCNIPPGLGSCAAIARGNAHVVVIER